MSSTKSINWADDLLRTALRREVGNQIDHVQVDLVIVTRATIRGLNHQYRQIDAPTDVLSFPLYSRADLQHELEPRTSNFKLQASIVLGTLAICPAVVRERAKEEKISYAERAAWTVDHGVKHLLGYDHDDTGETWFPTVEV